jgi:hypothetical protein
MLMITSSYAFSSNGRNPLDRPELNLKPDTIYDIPVENIRMANAIYFLQVNQLRTLNLIVEEQEWRFDDINMALGECNISSTAKDVVIDRKNLQLNEKDEIIKIQRTVSLTLSGIVVILATLLIVN